MKDVKVYLEDILDSIAHIESYIVGFDVTSFAKDDKVQDAVIRRLEIIGEATKRIPKQVRDAHAGVPWRQMSGMRDILIHEYAGVTTKTVWRTITEDLTLLREAVQNIKKAL